MVRPVNEARQTAIELGLGTYEGTVHDRCGTALRYVAGGSCVHCARAIATEQREARKFLKRHAIEQAEEKAREADGVTLDSTLPDGLDTDDAEARRQADLDELL